MKEKIISLLKSLVFLSIGLGLIWWVVKDLSDGDIAQIKNGFGEVNYLWLVASGIMAFLSHLSRSIRWKILLAPLGYNPKLSNTFYAVMVGYLANLAFPRLGEITKCALLNKYEKIPVHQSIGTIFVDRIMDLITLALMLVLLVLTQFNLLFQFTSERLISPILEKLKATVPEGYTLLIGIIALIIGAVFFYWISQKIKNSAAIIKLQSLLREFSKGFLTIRQLEKPYWFLFHSFFIWFMYFMMLYTAFQSMEITAGLGADAALALLVFGTFAFIIVQGGLGAYPYAVMEVLALYGIPSIMGFTFGWVAWSTQTLLIIVAGGLSLILLPLSNRKNKDELIPAD